MFKKNKENEIIKMEESTFIKRHAGKILLAGGLAVSAGAAYLLHKHNVDIAEHAKRIFNLEKRLNANTEIAVEALTDTIEAYRFEIDELIFKRDNLNDSQVNVFVNIPKLNEEIELKTRLRDNAIEMLHKAIENNETE